MPVIYNGVPGTSQGNLFEGLKLWVAQRVPQRARWVDLVKGNGGEVVRLEKLADMLIADNIKVGGVSPPPGSYMWRWIDDSVKNGFLQDKDDYLIGRREASARAPDSAVRTKVGRTAYTADDELILTKWVMAEERMGGALQGNGIYQALEKRHPQHPWQSWRHHWLSKLRDRPRPNFSNAELQLEIDQHRNQPPGAAAGPNVGVQPGRETAPQPQIQSRQTVQNYPATPRGRAQRPAVPGSSGRAEARGRLPYTQEEDQSLCAYVEKVRRDNIREGREVDKNLGGNVIYQKFAEKHPSRTWHSWRDRWLRHLSRIEAVDDAGPDEASSADRGEERFMGNQQLRQPPAIEQPPNPKSDDQRLMRKQREKREARATFLIDKTWRGYLVRRDMARLEAAVVPLQSLMRGYVARMRTASLAEAHQAASEPGDADASPGDEQYQDIEEDHQDADLGSDAMSPEDRDAREQFYADLQVVLGAVDVQIDSEPSIFGQRIDLWDLYRLATQQECELEARDWKLVTEGLGFEPVPKFVWKVHGCYLQNLAEFEHHIKIFESNDAMNEEEVEIQAETGRNTAAAMLPLTSHAVMAPEQPAFDPSSPPYRSSPPIARSKRTLGQTNLLRSDSGYPSSEPRKRRRVDRSSVIPPTPDEKMGLLKTPHGDGGVAPQGKSSPLTSRAIANGDAIEISSGDESDEDEDELPTRFDPPKKKFIEPETQDWNMVENPLFLNYKDDVRPSQQPRLESNAIKKSEQVMPTSQGAVADMDHRSSSAATINQKGVGGPSTRALGSSPRRGRDPVSRSGSLYAPINSKVSKRTLPASYQRKTASSTAATATASALQRETIVQARPHPNGTTIAHPSNTAPARTTDVAASTPKQTDARILTHATQSSTSRSLASSPRVPPQRTSYKDTPLFQDSEPWDEARVEAQISHFQALGYNPEDIVQAMEAATMSRGPMIVALASLSTGDGLPQDEAGVWTAEDCRDLRMIKKYERQAEKGKGIAGPAETKVKVTAWKLEKKHGKQGLEVRWKFMQMLGKAEGAE